MKTYHLYHGECLQAESKYRHVESQRAKIEQAGKGGGLTRKFRNFEKQSEKVSSHLFICSFSLERNSSILGIRGFSFMCP